MAEVKLGKMLDKAKHQRGQLLPYLRNVNVRWGTIDTDDLRKMYFEEDELVRFGLLPGDVLVCEGGEPGRAAVWVGGLSEIKYQKAIHRVRFKLPFEPHLLVYWLELLAQSGGLDLWFTGSTIKHFTRESFVQLLVPAPPLEEQRRIVAEIEQQFTRLEAGATALRKVQTKLKRYCAAVLKAACEGRLVPNEAALARQEGRPYEPASELLSRILTERRKNWTGRGKYFEPESAVSEELPLLPEGWSWATMPQLGEMNRGKSKHRPRDDSRLYDGPYPFIQTGDIRRSRGTIREHTQTYSEFGLEQSKLWPVGTVCITIVANIAETSILIYPACFPDSIVGFVQEHPVTRRYVELFIRTAKNKLETFAPATAQKNINMDVLSKVAIPLPPLAEQTRIVAEVERRLSVIEELEATIIANLQRAVRLRKSILAKAFGGR